LEDSVRSVLVVDDEPNIRAMVRDLLELSGYDVREAPNGAEALQALEAERPDCMVLDIMMPGLSGIDVLAAIRSRPELESLPVLLLSAAGDDQTTWEGWRAGANCYITKPFDPDRLAAWLNHLAKDGAYVA
jgi:two-component system, OmpR family, alkaline phosphatase synthesis response regulator PhoP